MNIHSKLTLCFYYTVYCYLRDKKNKKTNLMTLDIFLGIFKSSFNFIFEKADKTQVPVKIYEIIKSIRRVK